MWITKFHLALTSTTCQVVFNLNPENNQTIQWYATVVSRWHSSFQLLQAVASKNLSLYGILAQYFISFIIYKIWCQYRNSFSTLFFFELALFWFSAPNPSGSLIFSLRLFQFITFSALLSLFQVRFLFFWSFFTRCKCVEGALIHSPMCLLVVALYPK